MNRDLWQSVSPPKCQDTTQFPSEYTAPMRGPDLHQDTLFSTVNPASRVPEDHPLRVIRTMADTAFTHHV